MTLRDLLKQPATTIIDVRETWEFTAGHVEGSINMPLGTVPSQLEELKKLNGPIVLICASGNRSGMAASFLNSRGLSNAYNGGGWYEVKMLTDELRHSIAS